MTLMHWPARRRPASQWQADQGIANPMEPQRIESAVKQFLTERFDIPADKLSDHAPVRDLGLDSMMMLEVMLEVEDRLGVKLKDLSMPANPTLGDIVDLVQRNLENA
jgi:acyl carrier protein